MVRELRGVDVIWIGAGGGCVGRGRGKRESVWCGGEGRLEKVGRRGVTDVGVRRQGGWGEGRGELEGYGEGRWWGEGVVGEKEEGR